MADNKEFKDALWDAIVKVFYEFNGKQGTRFDLKDVQETLNEHKGFFDDDWIDDFYQDEDDYGDDTPPEYDPDAEEARKFMPGGEYDERDDDVYYDPTDGYEAPEGWHNSVEEAEDDYYNNKYSSDKN